MPKLFQKKQKQAEAPAEPKPKKKFSMPDVKSMAPDVSNISLDTFRNLTIMDLVACGVVILAVLVVAVMLMRNSVSQSAYDKANIENQGRITQLQAELDKLVGSQKPEEEDTEPVPVASALNAGAKLAQIQTAYIAVKAPSDGSNYYPDRAAEMAPYLTNEAQQISTKAWFPAFLNPSATTKRELFWSFESGYEFTADSITGTWLCYRKYSNYNQVVACALGTYTASTGLFSDIHTIYMNSGLTELGYKDGLGYDILNEFYKSYGNAYQTGEGGGN